MNLELSAVLGLVFGALAAACAFVIAYGELQAELVVSRQRVKDGPPVRACDVCFLLPRRDGPWTDHSIGCVIHGAVYPVADDSVPRAHDIDARLEPGELPMLSAGVRAAKPPSPVQIRAAPQKLSSNS